VEDLSAPVNPLEKYGWLRFIYELCDLDLSKVDNLIQRPAYEVFTFACYKHEKNQLEVARIERMMQRNKRG
jgi:hypothetical protein